MCTISNKIKFCSCAANIASLKNYWVLYRYCDDKKEIIIGETIMPYHGNREVDMYNRELLTLLLNEGEPFDVNIEPQEKDRLGLIFTSGEDTLYYGYEFAYGKWTELEFDEIGWNARHNAMAYGKIEHVKG